MACSETTPVFTTSRRREVSNDEMTAAMADHNNVNVMHSALAKYAGLIHPDDLESCGLHALWKTLGYHREEFGQKFTTSLYRFVDWECRRTLRRQRSERKHGVAIANMQDLPCPNQDQDDYCRQGLYHVRECMKLLSRQQQAILLLYYIDNCTMEEIGKRLGYSKESVRQKLDKATVRLRELCAESEASVYALGEASAD